ncbi:MAG: hypothetical protein AAF214_05080 [Pseudomonadota bacterium]
MTVPAPVPELQRLGCDEFEWGMLAVARYFLTAFQDPAGQAWQHGYTVATQRWGEAIGLPVAHATGQLVRAVLRCRSDGICFHDPLDQTARIRASRDEVDLIAMLHHMRRNETDKARDAVHALTHGRMDPDVIRTGLSLATRFSAGAAPAQTRRPALSIVP